MKSIRTLALVTGLLALSGVSQAQFSSTWTAVSDYDFRGFSQSSKNPALQASADYAVGDTGFSFGTWVSNVDFDNDEDLEWDLYANYSGKINDLLTITAGGTYYEYPLGGDTSGYLEAYIGMNIGPVGIKQWYSSDFYALGDDAMYTEANYTIPFGDKFSVALHAGYSWAVTGKARVSASCLTTRCRPTTTLGHFSIFAKFTGTDADDSNGQKITADLFNNEARGLIGVSTTFPWGK